MRTITFRPTWDSWREVACDALREEVPPTDIFWVPEEHDAQSTLPFVGLRSAVRSAPSSRRRADGGGPDCLPDEFVRFARWAAHHGHEERFALLYRLLWRLRHGEPELLSDMLDPDVFRFRRMAAAVREDLKETRSHLQLRDPGFQARTSVRAEHSPRLPDLVGWCEPKHRVLPLLAEALADRSPDRSFALLSPRTTAFWDGRTLELGPGADAAGSRSVADLAARWAARHRVAA